MLDQILFYTDCTQQECDSKICAYYLSIVVCVCKGRGVGRERERERKREREGEIKVWSSRMDTNRDKR